MVKQGGTFAQTDFTGTWPLHFLNTSISVSGTLEEMTIHNISTWAHGAFRFDGAGTVTAISFNFDDDTEIMVVSGAFTLDADGVLAGPLYPFGGCKRLSRKRRDGSGQDHDRFCRLHQRHRLPGVLVKQGGALTEADLVGTWNLNLFSSAGVQWLTFDVGDAFTAGTLAYEGGPSLAIRGGR